jgi:DNA-binding NarL/FixJ family response regulator
MKQENSNLNLIVASGYIEPELKSEMSYAGVREFIYKPYRIDQLVERLRAAVETPGVNK